MVGLGLDADAMLKHPKRRRLNVLWAALFLLLSLGSTGGFSLHDQSSLVRSPSSSRLAVVSEKQVSSTHGQGSDNSEEDDFFFIRNCLPAEIGQASDILTDAFFKDNTNFVTYQWERLTTYLSLEGTYPRPGERHALFVACHYKDGRVLGLAQIDDRPSDNRNDTPRPYMFNVAVAPNYRRKGIAKALVLKCEEVAKTAWGKPQVYLKVRDTSKAAIALYESLGYSTRASRVEKLNNKYQNLIIMSKDIM